MIDWLVVKWRITEPRQFIRNNGTDIRNWKRRLGPVVQAAFNEEVTRRNVRGVLSTERDKVMRTCGGRPADEAKAFGIEIVDVRIKRVDFVADITDSVYRRMESERKQVANNCAPGRPNGEKIRADADRQREVIIAEAYRDAQKIRAKAIQGVGALCRGLRPRPAVRAVLSQPGGLQGQLPQDKSDVMVLDPVRFFHAATGAGSGAAQPAAAPRRAGVGARCCGAWR